MLENEGLINRCYGGASIISHDNRDIPYIVRDNFNSKIKMELARQAVSLIPDGSTVFLDASSTVSHMARLLTKEQNLIVVTNSINVCTILAEKNIEVYCIGGKMINDSLAFAGSKAIEAVSTINIDYMFFSSRGIDEYGNITDYSEEETQLRKTVLKLSAKKYFICDSSKLSSKYMFSVCNIKDIDGIICDIKYEFNNNNQ